MKKITRIFAVVLTAALAAMMCITSASAESIFETKNVLKNGVSETAELYNAGENIDYKFTVTQKGIFSLKYRSELQYTKICLIDSDGASVYISDTNITSGHIAYGGKGSENVRINSDYNTGIASGIIEWNVNSGTYYLRVIRDNTSYDGGDFIKLTPSFPSGKSSSNSSKVSSSSNATIKINMEVGDKIDLSAMSGNKEVNAKWSSSNSKIAKVSSKGKITALKEGSCTITWTSGSSTFTIYVEVE